MIPKKLYKYESLNNHTIRNLKNAQLFFNTPSSFNDPFDCATLEPSVSLSEEDIIKIYTSFIEKQNDIPNIKIKSINDILKNDINKILSKLKETLKEKEDNWRNQTGCSCFTTDKYNILMWSHYADSHKGICLEFDTSYEPFSKALEVTYENDFPQISPMVFFALENNPKELFKPLLTKHKDWKYEKEWRIFHKEPNKLFTYNVNALSAIYFGAEVNDTDIEIICLILQGQCKNINFYKMKKNKTSYKLDIEQFSYVPYIKMKER